LENLTVADQVCLFASAEVVVAAHGAGLTNLVLRYILRLAGMDEQKALQ